MGSRASRASRSESDEPATDARGIALVRGLFWHSGRPTRRFRVLAAALTVVTVAATMATVLLTSTPQPAAAAQSSTPLSTVSKSGTDTTTNSTAVSGGPAGTANPGDTIKWVTDYTNNTNSASATQVQWKDPITAGQTYVNGSLQLPAGMSPQYSTNGGSTYTAGAPVAGSTGVGATGTVDPAAAKTSTSFTNAVANFNTPGGDGYSVEGFGSNIYTVYHHSPNAATVFCSTLSNAVCPGWPAHASYVSAVPGAALGTGAISYTTAGVNGSFIEGGLLYWPVGALAAVGGRYAVGLQCLNLTTLVSCGFTQLDTVTAAPVSAAYGQLAGDGIRATNGRYYFVDTTGNLLCFNPTTASSCGVTNAGIGPVTVSTAYHAEVGTYGNYLYFTYTTGNNDNYLFGYNVGTATPTLVTAQSVGPTQSGSPSEVLPVLSAAGAVLGACSVFHAAINTGCYSTADVQIANPYPLTQYGFSPPTLGFGTGVMVGTKYYITYSSTSTLCYDFALRVGTGQVPACAGFAGPADLQSYTVRPLANLPGCMADNGNGAQIVIFNGATGGPCVTASSSVSVQAPSWCDGQSHSVAWGTVKLNGLTGSEYSGGASVTVSGSAGAVPGFTGVTLAPGQTTLDISSIPATGSTASLTVTVNLAGVTNQATVSAGSISISRTGDTYSQMCYSTTVNPVACSTSTTITDAFTAITTAGATTDAPAGNTTPTATFTVAPTSAQCALLFKKVASAQSGSPGQTVTYTVTVTNSGTMPYAAAAPATFNDSLTNVLSDATYKNDANATAGTVAYTAPNLSWTGPLAAGASATIRYSVLINDPDNGPHDLANTVVSSLPSNCAQGSTDPLCTSNVPISGITVVKSASPGDVGHFTVGQVVTYSFVITNTGNVSLANVVPVEGAFTGSGSMSVPVCDAGAASLAPGAQVTCTALYTITQADVDAGSITNHVTATGTPPSGPDPVSPDSQVTIPAPSNPSIGLLKSATPTTVTAAGQSVAYSFLVTNTGNVTLTNPQVTETAFSGTGTAPAPVCPPATLLPGAQVTCTATYVATQADLDAGSITNTATATGTPPSGTDPVSDPSSAAVTATPAPAITLIKTATPSSVGKAGDSVTYSFLVTNTGNVTLRNVTVDEGAFTGSGAISDPVCPAGAASLAPGDSVTCTAGYTLSQADVDAGSITNTATATGTPTSGPAPVSPPSSAVVTVPPASALTVVKSVTPTSVGKVGDSVTYSFLVTNTGNTTLKNPQIAETTFSGTGTAPVAVCPPATLAPGDSVTCTAGYTLTQADVDAGTVTNSATATATPPSGPDPVSPPSQAVVTVPPASALTLVKSVTPTSVGKVGDSVTYSFLVTNTGNTTLKNPQVAEKTFSGTGTAPAPACPPATLAPGDSVTCTADYTLTQADVNAGKVTNTATATANAPSGPDPVSPESSAVVTVPPAPAITVVKSASPGDVGHFTVGQVVTYSFVITNTGNVSLANVVPVEGAFTGSGSMSVPVCDAGAASLAPGAQVTCTALYTITQADVDAGSITNHVTATGTPPSGPDPVSPDSQVTIPAPSNPSIGLLKSATPTTVTAAGQSVAYSFLVTNTGNVTLTNPQVTETAFSGTGTAPAPVCPPATLLPGAQVTCTATYVATQADLDAGSITNTATATGTPPSGTDPVSDPSSAAVTATPAPAITLIKTATPIQIDSAGQVITYSFLITNTGNVSLKNPTVAETDFTGTGSMPNANCPAIVLAPGASVTCTADYTATQADVDAGSVKNTATATGTPQTGKPPVSEPSSAVVAVEPDPALTVVKSASPSDPAHYTVGQLLTYSFVITNTGNETLTHVQPIEGTFTGSGTMSSPVCPAGADSLAPGLQVTCTATYTITQADVDAGSITNNATATGTPPSGPDVVSPRSTVTLPDPPAPALTLVKTASVKTIAQAGQAVTYSFLITNTGNVTLVNVKPDEGTFTGSGVLTNPVCPAAAASMLPGAQVTCTADYTVTKADVAQGKPLLNTATAIGTPPSGNPITSDPSTVKLPDPTAASGLADTGSNLNGWFVYGAPIILIIGLGAILLGRRRRRSV
ncbi:DUF7507 domain-containing protein [Rathayibacter sp. KR2-224]|uniref:DUF7507 domain-containing protein n=1 Tax=Rathayibacter sp. KR2-224 TaxID=3400913 RepID=UPI003BFDC5A1